MGGWGEIGEREGIFLIFTCSIRLIDHRLYNSSPRIDEPVKNKEINEILVSVFVFFFN